MVFRAALRKEFTEQWRTYRFLVLILVVLFFGLSSPVLAKYTPELVKMASGSSNLSIDIPAPTVMDAAGQYVKNTSQFGFLLALLLSMGMVVQEKEKRTAAMILVKPISRATFLASKFLALSLAFLASLVLAGLGAYYYTVILFQPVNFGTWMLMNLLLWVYLVMYIALTMMFSTLSRSQAAAAGLSFGVLLVLGLAGTIGKVADYLPAQLITWSVGLMAGNSPSYWWSLGISLGVSVACLVISWVMFRKQEL
jgi:ABC-2 type transport system permease protein